MFWFAMILTIVSNVFYHIFQKVTPQEANPALALAVSYLVASVVCLLLIPVFPLKEGLWGELKQLNWASFALAFTLVGLEIGFLLAYRAGWSINIAGIVSNATVSILLIPIGLWIFRDQLTRTNVIGIAFAIIGLILMNWRE